MEIQTARRGVRCCINTRLRDDCLVKEIRSPIPTSPAGCGKERTQSGGEKDKRTPTSIGASVPTLCDNLCFNLISPLTHSSAHSPMVYVMLVRDFIVCLLVSRNNWFFPSEEVLHVVLTFMLYSLVFSCPTHFTYL